MRDGGHITQINYLFIRNKDIRFCKDYQVFSKEVCASQHRLLAIDSYMSCQLSEGMRVVTPRILW